MSDYEEVLGSVTSSDSGSSASGYGSGLIGGILDAVIGPVMANEQFQRAKHVSNRQMGAARFIAENQPSWAMQGLINAGLNPVLAATRGVSQPSFSPSSGTSLPNTGSLARALEGGVSSARQLTMLSKQGRILDEQLKTAQNEARASGQLETKMNAEVSEILKRVDFLEQQTQTSASQVDVNSANAEAARSTARRTDVLRDLDKAALPGAEAEAELYETELGETVKQASPVIRLLKEILGSKR